MPVKRLGAEQIIPKLREAEVDLAKGSTVAQVCKKIGVTDETRSQYTPCHSLALIWRGLLLVLIN